jgi:lyso-ornithine lipid O-acyltransferase
MKQLRLAWRLVFSLTYTSRIVAEMLLKNALLGKNLDRTMGIRRRWAKRLLRGVGIRLEVLGEVPSFPCLLVANHRSHIDPILILQDKDALPVAKIEMANWPLLGKGAALSGIIYIKREASGSRLQVLRLMADHLKKGRSIILFPEGTTSALQGTLPFLIGGFQVAAKMDIPVVPVTLIFADEADYWVTKEPLLSHAGRRFREQQIRMRVVYGPPLQSKDPNMLLESAKSWIDGEIAKAYSAEFVKLNN